MESAYETCPPWPDGQYPDMSKIKILLYINVILHCSLQEKVKFILQATFQHARNLALLTTVYKILTLLFRKLTGRDHPLFTFIGAFAGGYLVFGENNKINMQVSLYICTLCVAGHAENMVS